MAKKHNTVHAVESQAPTQAETVTLTLPADWKATAHGFTIEASQLTPANMAYLLTNGFTQSITDAAAFSKADKDGKSDEEVMEMADAKRAKKYTAILLGTITTGTRGPRTVGREKVLYEVAEFFLRQAVAGKAIKLPTKAAELDTMLDAYIAKYGDKVNAEVDRRMAEAQTIKAESEDFDLQSLLA